MFDSKLSERDYTHHNDKDNSYDSMMTLVPDNTTTTMTDDATIALTQTSMSSSSSSSFTTGGAQKSITLKQGGQPDHHVWQRQTPPHPVSVLERTVTSVIVAAVAINLLVGIVVLVKMILRPVGGTIYYDESLSREEQQRRQKERSEYIENNMIKHVYKGNEDETEDNNHNNNNRNNHEMGRQQQDEMDDGIDLEKCIERINSIQDTTTGTTTEEGEEGGEEIILFDSDEIEKHYVHFIHRSESLGSGDIGEVSRMSSSSSTTGSSSCCSGSSSSDESYNNSMCEEDGNHHNKTPMNEDNEECLGIEIDGFQQQEQCNNSVLADNANHADVHEEEIQHNKSDDGEVVSCHCNQQMIMAEDDNHHDNDDDDDSKPMCTICFNVYENGEYVCKSKNMNCKHVYHFECMKMWLQRHDKCPVCRLHYLIEASEQ